MIGILIFLVLLSIANEQAKAARRRKKAPTRSKAKTKQTQEFDTENAKASDEFKKRLEVQINSSQSRRKNG